MLGALKQALFDVSIGIHGAVPFQMVGRQRGPNADGWPHFIRRFNLVATHLHHDPIRFGLGWIHALQP